jgi:hypothetical protein
MKETREYYKLLGEINEVKDLLSEVLRRLGKIEMSGTINYGTPNHISDNHHKYVTVKLERKDDD